MQGLDVAVSGGVGTLTLNRPEKLNALTREMWRALPSVLAAIDADPAVRVLVVRGAGTNFSAGSDVGDLGVPLDDFWETNAGAEAALAGLDVPTIAAIEGVCLGGGTELAAACDIRLAAPGSRFGIPAARLGVVYPPAPTRRLAEAVGPSWARYLMLTGEVIGSGRAESIGLLHRVADDPHAAAWDLAKTIASRSALTHTAMKRILLGEDPAPEGWLAEAYSREIAEGQRAFAERDRPHFTFGRDEWCGRE